ncbi:hypothetical protein WOLCODRAFT_167385, partial [Wolfiporia cocos MD-104 SS10]
MYWRQPSQLSFSRGWIFEITMASITPPEVVEFLVQESTLMGYISGAGAVLILYDYILTFNQERMLMWGSKSRVITAIFLVNRCVMLSTCISLILNLPIWKDVVSEEVTYYLFEVAEILSPTLWAVFSAFRSYIVSNHCWPTTLLTLVLGLMPVFTTLI